MKYDRQHFILSLKEINIQHLDFHLLPPTVKMLLNANYVIVILIVLKVKVIPVNMIREHQTSRPIAHHYNFYWEWKGPKKTTLSAYYINQHLEFTVKCLMYSMDYVQSWKKK